MYSLTISIFLWHGFGKFSALYPDKDSYRLKRIQIWPNDTDPYRSGSETLIFNMDNFWGNTKSVSSGMIVTNIFLLGTS